MSMSISALTTVTYAMQGDLKLATPTEPRPMSVLPFNFTMEAKEEVRMRKIIPHDTVDELFDLGALPNAIGIVITLDTQRLGSLKIRFQIGDRLLPLQHMFVLFGTDIDTVYLTNDSGNEAAVVAYAIG